MNIADNAARIFPGSPNATTKLMREEHARDAMVSQDSLELSGGGSWI